MRSAIVIALKDLRLRARDRSAFIVAFIAPIALATVISLAVGEGFSGGFSATYGVLDEDRSELSRAFTEEVLGSPALGGQVRVVPVRTEEAARELLDRDGLAAAFIIPAGFSEEVTANRSAAIGVLRNPDAPIGAEVAETLANAYTDQINATRLAVLTSARASDTAPTPEAVAAMAREAAAERIPVRLVDGPVAEREVSGASYYGPAMAIFFLFFATGFTARGLLAEREQGTLARILAAPVRGGMVIAGKAITGLVVGLSTLVVMFLTFRLAFGVRWGDPVALGVLSVVTVLAVMGVTAVVQIFARTQERADAYSSLVAVGLALIGGSFFPLHQMPEAMQRVATIAPNAWALRGFTDIVYDGAGVADIGTNIAVIIAFAVVTGGIAYARARRLDVR